MLGKGLESLIPSGGYKPQANNFPGVSNSEPQRPSHAVPFSNHNLSNSEANNIYQAVTTPSSVSVNQSGVLQNDFSERREAIREDALPKQATYEVEKVKREEPVLPKTIISYDEVVDKKEEKVAPHYDIALKEEAYGKKDYSSTEGLVHQIDVNKIFPNPHQPRRHFDEEALNDLANSIREFGIIQPLVVTKIENSYGEASYQLIAGERRLMASKRVGLKTVPVVIKSVREDRERLELAIIENIQRENLNPLEAARSYSRLQDEFNLTQREIAQRMGKSRETIANTLRLLHLPTEIQKALEEGLINESHARILLQVDDIGRQREMFSSILRFKPSVRELKAELKRYGGRDRDTSPRFNSEIMSFQARLEEVLGTKVQIEDSGEKGKITISYYSNHELADLISKLSRPWGNF